MINNRGFGFKESMLFLVTIFFCIIITMLMYNRTFKELFAGKETTTYSQMVKQAETAANAYTDNYYYKVLKNGDSGYVTTTKLQKLNLLDKLIDVKDKHVTCKGYVTFKTRKNNTTYTAYLKCGNLYKTKGYNSRYEN